VTMINQNTHNYQLTITIIFQLTSGPLDQFFVMTLYVKLQLRD